MFPRGVVSPCCIVGFYSTGVCDTRQEVSGTFSKNIPSLCLDEGDTGAGDAAAAQMSGQALPATTRTQPNEWQAGGVEQKRGLTRR